MGRRQRHSAAQHNGGLRHRKERLTGLQVMEELVCSSQSSEASVPDMKESWERAWRAVRRHQLLTDLYWQCVGVPVGLPG